MSNPITRKYPRCIATISAGFEKGDFLVREEKGQRVYFDFFEEAFNYIAAKGYSRMPKAEEGEWMDLMVSEGFVFTEAAHCDFWGGGIVGTCIGAASDTSGTVSIGGGIYQHICFSFDATGGLIKTIHQPHRTVI